MTTPTEDELVIGIDVGVNGIQGAVLDRRA